MLSESEQSPEKCVYNRENDPQELKIRKLKRMVAKAMTRLAILEESIEKSDKIRRVMAKKVTELQKKFENSQNEKKAISVENEKLLNLVTELELLNS